LLNKKKRRRIFPLGNANSILDFFKINSFIKDEFCEKTALKKSGRVFP